VPAQPDSNSTLRLQATRPVFLPKFINPLFEEKNALPARDSIAIGSQELDS
jgi:hypothetical protein